MNGTRTNRRSGAVATPRKIREIMTPEGVCLRVELAERGDRAGAVIMDLFILGLTMLVSGIAIMWLTGLMGMARFGIILVLLLIFALRNFYFMYFELKWQGQTPGKRKMGIKVIDRFGQPLTSEAIFARNIMREIELFLPMGLMFAGNASGVTGLMQFFAFLWALALVCLPLANRDNLRAGDLIAGTLVVREPKIILAKDVMAAQETATHDKEAAYAFTTAQLDAYGIFELQTLEGLLRNQSMEAVASRLTAGRAIIKKIGWMDPVSDRQMDEFLSGYYHALRKRLEGQLLMGERKEDKFDTGGKT